MKIFKWKDRRQNNLRGRHCVLVEEGLRGVKKVLRGTGSKHRAQDETEKEAEMKLVEKV